MRHVIAQFHGDAGHYPASLDVLVERGLLRAVPRDPITGSSDTWVLIREAAEQPRELGGIVDVRSGAIGKASDGRSYEEW